jgi:hypothetical protein
MGFTEPIAGDHADMKGCPMKNYLASIIENLSSRLLARACYRAIERMDQLDKQFPMPRRVCNPELPQVEFFPE